MGYYYTGQIILFAGNYAPVNFLPCDGRTLQVAEFQALFSLIGTMYGGNGATDFKLPDLRGRLALGKGQGVLNPKTGGGGQLPAYALGQQVGTEAVALSTTQIPAHTHALNAVNAAASTNVPTGALLANVPTGTVFYIDDQPGPPAPSTVALGAAAISVAGAGAPHANVMPSLPLGYLICVEGLYPTPE